MAESDGKETLKTLANGLEAMALNLEQIIMNVSDSADQWSSDALLTWGEVYDQFRRGEIDRSEANDASTEAFHALQDARAAQQAVEAVQRARVSILEAAAVADRDSEAMEE